MGSDEFIETNLARLDLPKDLTEYSKAERKRPPKPITWYSNNTNNRNDAIVVAYAGGGYTLKEIGDHFGIHYTIISGIVKNHKSVT